ncbi:mCpol domain-containing protein [Nostoc sp. FACHB-110]|uniref:mCpol domain-containing protein n=1 Tax=Nostoc sp. FACHB-110 TaxID=2692834 RepID=UPI001686F81C|nr:mCpol domain-containing protein [Nostoc sp. FACHB-110]MBD2441288.1 mCpol domain-containing protein [Nostoc sp. FACHB-110]
MVDVYAFLDGDNIGIRIANLLNKGKSLEASLLSENIKTAIFEIDMLINSKPNIKIIIIGGDDVLIKYDYDEYGTKILEEIIDIFKRYTGLSMSCGIGLNLEQTLVNLDNAKTGGKNRIEKPSQLILNKMSKAATLYLFTDSNRPDVYVNSITCCAEEEDYTLREVYFLAITRDKGQITNFENRLENIQKQVSKQLELLQVGKYLYLDNPTKTWLEKDIDISSHDKLRYTKSAQILFKIDVILYDSLEEKILSYTNIAENRNEICIFDLSAAIKSLMIDIYTILRINNIYQIRTFEIKKRVQGRDFDERELIHNLYLDHNEYEYTFLCEGVYTSKSIIKSLTKNNLDFEYADKLNKVIDAYADEFANFWLTIIFVIALLFLVICIVIVIQNGWSWLEPWTFVIFGPPTLYLLTLLVKIIWKRELSVDPGFLYELFKNWKKQKIKN